MSTRLYLRSSSRRKKQMSINIQDVSKLYGDQRALNEVSFSIPTGQVVGFLGPNGAGKSTMMKIITCFIPATAGKVEVCGLDVMDNSIEVRKRVGYLPEHNPLYLDMYVKEFLMFIAGIYKLPNRKERVAEMIEKVGLSKEQHKKIGALSKGYRQRVGLAQAMIHDPEVLILDEPTSGLDPNQLVEIRELIKNLGKEKTVMLSTHIMQEVEAICDRVIIINNGNIVADGSPQDLSDRSSRSVLRVEFENVVFENQLMLIEGVDRVDAVSKTEWIIQGSESVDLRKIISKWANEQGELILTLQQEKQNMEDIFKDLTK